MEADQDLNGIKLWQYMIQIYMHDGNKAIRIQRLESIISVKYTPNYPGGIDKWVLSYDNAFAELVLLEQRQWNLDSTKKNRILANAKAMDIDHTLLRQITRDMTYAQTSQIFRSHAIDKRYSSDSSSKTYKIHHTNTELATALLTRIEPEIWAKLPQDIKSLVIEKRKKEAEEKTKEEGSSGKPSGPKTLPSQCTKANLVTQQLMDASDGEESPDENYVSGDHDFVRVGLTDFINEDTDKKYNYYLQSQYGKDNHHIRRFR